MRTLEVVRYFNLGEEATIYAGFAMSTIASMDFLAGEGQDIGQIWTLGHLKPLCKSTYRMMDGI